MAVLLLETIIVEELKSVHSAVGDNSLKSCRSSVGDTIVIEWPFNCCTRSLCEMIVKEWQLTAVKE